MLDVVAWVGIIAIIFVALTQIILLIGLILIVFKLRAMLGDLQAKIGPLLTTAQETTTTVRGTTDFVATTAVRPLIRMLAIAAAVQRFFQVLFGVRRSS